MAAKYYAWTTIQGGNDGVAEPGDVVVPKNYDEDDWDQLVAAGSVRTRQFPKMPKEYQGSPNGFRLWQFRQLQEGMELDLEEAGDDMLQLELEDSDE